MSTDEADPRSQALEPLVLGRVGFRRTAGDIWFLAGLPDTDREVIEGALASLEREGHVRSSPSPRGPTYECTNEGRRWLETSRGLWTFDVIEVFSGSFRPQPLLAGRLGGGELRCGDRFLLGDRLGRVIGVELVNRRDRSPDEFVIVTDLSGVATGDVLRRIQVPEAE